MARLAPARRAALELVRECRLRDAHARDLLRGSDVMDGLDPRDRGLATRLVTGVQRTRGLLDATVDAHLARRGHLEPRLRDALRVATFELLYLSTPAEVAVSQGVEMARAVQPRARGLANAVLHRVAEQDAPLMGEARVRLEARLATGSGLATDLAADFARVAALPEWLARELLASMGAADACRMALSALEPPAPTVAANGFLLGEREAYELLAKRGLEPRRLDWPGAFSLGRLSGLAGSGLVEDVRILPADPAAQIVSWLVAPAGDATMLEIGQGRGTKTILTLGANRRLGGCARMTCLDSEGFKVRVARERLATAGLDGRARCLEFDARRLGEPEERLPRALRRPFDQVFVDAPCSGTGTLRRHPEIAWSLERSSVQAGGMSRTDGVNGPTGLTGALPELQLEILMAAAARVRRGGVLLYSTCSELRSEDEDVVHAFLASESGRDFSVEPVTAAPCVDAQVGADAQAGLLSADAGGLLNDMVTPDGFLRTGRVACAPEAGTAGGLTHGLDCDGHFLARLRRAR